MDQKRCFSYVKENKSMVASWGCQICPQPIEMPVQRRSGNYPPNQCGDDFILSLGSTHKDKQRSENIEEIKEVVGQMVEGWDDPVAQMELVDSLERLGVSYHFEKEINVIMDFISKDKKEPEDLYIAAFKFRLLSVFKNQNGRFEDILAEDTKGLFFLYEASHLGFEGETILEEAMTFAGHHLEESIKMLNSGSILARQVVHALELPLSRRMLRSEASSYIDLYESMLGHQPGLLKLAKLDFNNVQSLGIVKVVEGL